MSDQNIFFLFSTVLKHKKCTLGHLRWTHGSWTISLIGLWCYKKCGVTTLVIVLILLGGAMHINKGRLRKHKLKNKSYPLLGTHQNTGIGVSQKTKKVMQKNCGHKHEPFCVWWPDTKNWSSPGPKDVNKMIDLFKDAFWYIIEEMTCVMVNILKYVPGVQGVDEAVSVRPRYLTFVIDQEVRRKPCGLKHFSDDLKDQAKLRFVKLRWFDRHFLIMKLL